MGAHTYCPRCGNGLLKPGADEVVAGMRHCYHCHHTFEVNTTKDDLIVELAETIAELTDRIASLEEKSARHANEIYDLNARLNQGDNQ